ncbi:acetylornithine aminotransferase [Clostridium sp. CAG:1013]|nr:acetylornithine aminotransferase [Clostridium sp. CAG:1013]
MKPGMQGSTFGGNPVSCAGARVVVRRVSDPAFLESVKEKGAYLKEHLEAMPQVEYVRGKGLMLGVKLKDKDAHDVLVECAKQGLLILTAKELVRFLPPLTITKEDIDQGLAIFQKVLEQ